MDTKRNEECNTSEARIISIKDNTISVVIEQKEECSGCAAMTLCEKTSDRGKTLDIVQNNASNFSVGEKVLVNTPQSSLFKALMLAFAYPLLIIVGLCLLGHYFFGWNDGISALFSLVLLGVYYFILYKKRNTSLFNFSLYISKA